MGANFVLLAATGLTCILASTDAMAKTWYVGGVGADFDEVQPAIDAASDGDLILVRPSKDYDGFTITKGVTVRATECRFALASNTRIKITDLPPGKAARLSSLEMRYGYSSVEVMHCSGEVMLDDIQLGVPDQHASYAVKIYDSIDVHISDLSLWLGRAQCSSAPFAIVTSVVQMSGVSITAGKNWGDDNGDGYPGAPALICDRSWIVLDRPDILGGEGGDSGDACLYSSPSGGPGGAGVVAWDSVLLVMGLGDRVKGGTGGELQRGYSSCPGSGGRGGTGLTSDSSVVRVSGVSLIGGKGGTMWHGGQGPDGEPFEGAVDFVEPQFPVLETTRDFHPGAGFTTTIHGVPGARVLVLMSDQRAWVTPPYGVAGAPLSALPGGWFVAVQGGMVPASASLVLDLELPDDPLVRGFAITSQAVLFDASSIALTNATHRVVGE